ncbi:MAG: phosphoribosylglycinamide formyltransferase [Acidimicrobiaceae bacterium]|nr:phosphoribosylglycinamide formyltransferase [Acidimicrobiaceae bacterium]
MRIGVLASGSGTILEAILENEVDVSLVVTDRPCRAIEVARSAGVPSLEIPRTSYGNDFDRDGYSRQLAAVLEDYGIELIAMAGYGTILSTAIHDRFGGRIMNTHPSLLPSFPGWHAVESALSFGVKVTGCTVHLATLEVDAGPILAQEAVKIFPGDDRERLHERIKEIERLLYPATIASFAKHLASGISGPFDLGLKVVRDGQGVLMLKRYEDCEDFR